MRMSKVRHPRPPLDPELEAALSLLQINGAVSVTPELISAFRERADAAATSLAALELGGAVEIEHHAATATDGSEIPLLVVRPRAVVGVEVPGIYNIHGGGMVMGNCRTGIDVVLEWAMRFGAVVVSVEYRLAPEFPHPVPAEDCYRAMLWLFEHATRLGIDAERVLVAGASAGGGLSAAMTLMSRDLAGPRLRGQVLMGPMLDDRNESHSSYELIGEGIWDRTSNQTGWDALLGTARGGPDVSPYAAPARATDLSGLPAAYVDAGSVEVFRDEAVAYAQRLWHAGTQAELHIWGGGFHSFDTIAPQSVMAVIARQTRTAWVGRLLADS
jgi:acetyl esterase/lipase